MKTLISLCLLLVLSACASAPKEKAKDAEDAYNRGKGIVERGEYGRATVVLDKFSAKYPYSKFAAAAELLRLKAAYLDEQFVLSETLGLRFISAHPEHQERVYAQYLVAMSYYKESSGAKLDQEFSHKARAAFTTLARDFPNNPYTDEIKDALILLTNRVAEHEMLVGKFYYDRELYVAAINRFIKVKNEFLHANVAAQSLYYLASSYLALKQTDDAQEINGILRHQFADTAWSKKSAALM